MLQLTMNIADILKYDTIVSIYAKNLTFDTTFYTNKKHNRVIFLDNTTKKAELPNINTLNNIIDLKSLSKNIVGNLYVVRYF